MAKPGGTPKISPRLTGAAKTSRLTENKRRYRQRRKEYVSDIERKLAEAQEKGIQATKEMQTAGRRVALENGRLRQLLQLAGFEVEDIDFWCAFTFCTGSEDATHCARRRQIEQQARRCAAIVASSQRSSLGSRDDSSCNGNAGKSESATSDIPNRLVSESNSSTCGGLGTVSTTQSEPPINEDSLIPQGGDAVSHARMPPCRLLSRLAENPTADITQVVELANEKNPPPYGTAQQAGIECSKAYEMLMRYATSEERMDYIAQALEAGCSADGKGGCSVKSKAVLQALDDMCG